MALRYDIDVAGENYRPLPELRTFPAARKPEVVNFSAGANLEALANSIVAAKAVDVCAAVGSGKSTKLPDAIARASGALVFLVVPNPLLAVHLYDYATSLGGDLRRCLVVDSKARMPSARSRPAVVYISSSQMVARLLKDRECVKKTTIYLDEAHESDAYSYILRHLVLSIGAKRVVRASATFSPDVVRSRNTPSRVNVEQYAATPTSEWDVQDVSKPWYYSTDHNIVVYVDSLTDAKQLADKYRKVGCAAHVLRSKSSVADFRQAMRDTTNDSLITVLLLDYSFRSGFTFLANTIVDTGYVRYAVSSDGRAALESRPIYAFEAEQTAGRLGRVANLDATYFRPKAQLERVRTDVEGVELQAVAYLCRVLGYTPKPEAAGLLMAKHDLPSDVEFEEAMCSQYPLTCRLDKHVLEKSSRASSPVSVSSTSTRSSTAVPPVTGTVLDFQNVTREPEPKLSAGKPNQRRTKVSSIVSDSDSVDTRTNVSDTMLERGVARKGKGVETDVEATTSSLGDTSLGAEYCDKSSDIVQDWQTCLKQPERSSTVILQAGKHYYPPNVSQAVVSEHCARFPGGADSVIPTVLAERTKLSLKRVYGEADWEYAMAVTAQRYNMAVVEAEAMRKALRTATRELQFDPSGSRNREIAKQIVAEIVNVDKSVADGCKCLERLITDSSDLCMFGGLPNHVATRENFHEDRYLSVLVEPPQISEQQYVAGVPMLSGPVESTKLGVARDFGETVSASQFADTRGLTSASDLMLSRPSNSALITQQPGTADGQHFRLVSKGTYQVPGCTRSGLPAGATSFWFEKPFPVLHLVTTSVHHTDRQSVTQQRGVRKHGHNPYYGCDPGPLPPSF